MSAFSKVWTWLKWPLALACLTYLYARHSSALNELAERPKDWRFLVLGFVLCLSAALMTFYRWYLLVWAQGFSFRIRDAVRLGFLGMLFNYVGPGSVGGDLFKAVILAREQASRRTVAAATVVLDRILGLLALFMVGAVSTLFYRHLRQSVELRTAALFLWVGSLGGLIGLGLMLSPSVTRWRGVRIVERLPLVGHALGELLHGVELYQTKKKAILLSVLVSLVAHIGMIGGFYCCALAMRQAWIPDLGAHYYFMPIAELFGVLIPVPGGVGTLEGAIAQSYRSIAAVSSIPGDQAFAAGLAAALAFRVVTVAIAAVGLAYYVTARKEISQALEDAAHVSDAPLPAA